MSPAKLYRDKTPDETNTAVETLKLTFQSWVLLTGHTDHEYLRLFLAHFPSLRNLVISIKDFGERNEGSLEEVSAQSREDGSTSSIQLRDSQTSVHFDP
jgi:hypothetical protein